mgnify:CR=1 FL=1
MTDTLPEIIHQPPSDSPDETAERLLTTQSPQRRQASAAFEVEIDGKPVKLRTVFDLVRQHLRDTWSLANVEKVTWAPALTAVRKAKTHTKTVER